MPYVGIGFGPSGDPAAMAVALAAQATADAALPRVGGHLTGSVTAAPGVTIDGRDLSLDGADLDVVQAAVDNLEQDDG